MRRTPETNLIGTSTQISELLEEIARVARSDAKVLITGESGVGKEIVARSIHAQSLRAVKPFVTVNCAGIPDSLLESELFGHVRGSFTGAYRDRPGNLELADQGTIFLDEVGEMSLRMQSLLLRFLETGEVQKVGADRAGNRVDARVVAATNRNIPDLVSQGQFREDLFYRLNVIHLVVPPLRDRKEDVSVLAEHFLQRFSEGFGRSIQIDPDAMTALTAYAWPGNVRELGNVIERAVVRCRGDAIRANDLPAEITQTQEAGFRPARERRRTVSDDLYRKLVEDRESFWTTVYPLYMQREITRADVKDLVSKGLAEARGNYKIVVRLFNMDSSDYKRFLNFLRKHHCDVPFKEYR